MSDFSSRKSGVIISPQTCTQRPSYVLVGASKSFDKEYVNPIIYKTPTYDQGTSYMCVPCALAVSRYLIEYEQSNNRKRFSPAMIYANRLDTDYQGEGMYVIQAIASIIRSGVCFAEDLDMYSTYNICKAAFNKDAESLKEKGKPYRVSSMFRCDGEANIKQVIKEVGFALVTVPIYSALYYPTSDNKISYDATANNYNNGYHCMIAVGWNGYGWIIKNSWGDSYGDNGIINLPYQYPIQEAYTYVDQVKEAKYIMIENYKDGKDAAWAVDALEKCLEGGILNGYDEGDGTLTLRPNASVTRAELAAILVRAGIVK